MTSTEKPAALYFGLFFLLIGLASMIMIALWPDRLMMDMWTAQLGVSTLVFAGLSFVARSNGWRVTGIICSAAVVMSLTIIALYFFIN